MRAGCGSSSSADKDSTSAGTLKMKAARFSETSEETSYTTCNNPGKPHLSNSTFGFKKFANQQSITSFQRKRKGKFGRIRRLSGPHSVVNVSNGREVTAGCSCVIR
jgi:hypothetical protein